MHQSYFKNGRMPLAGRLIAAGLIVGMTSTAAFAGNGTSAWIRGNLSQVRLISGGTDGTTHQAGVEIRLKGKAHTYWRNPGDGGVPPVFDFSNSKNVKITKVFFPAPTRSGPPGEEIIGYERAVVFPLTVKPINPGQPMVLDLKLHYAACEKICVPELARMRLQLDNTSAHPGPASVISAFAAQLPAALAATGAPSLTIKAGEAGKSWDVSVKTTQGKIIDLFVEAPEGWYFDQSAKAAGSYKLTLAQKPEKASAMPPVHFTVTSSAGAFEGKRALP